MRDDRPAKNRPTGPTWRGAGSVPCGRTRSSSAHIIGTVVSDSTNEIRMVSVSVIENSKNSRPAMPPSSRIGVNTATSETVIDSTVKPTSRAPSSAASSRPMPASMCRAMFSSTTMASSTTKPVAMVSAISDRLSSENPIRYIAAKVAMIEVGTATAGIRVERSVRRNTSTTRITSATETARVNWVSASEARMVAERSIASFSSTPPGIAARSCGSIALIWSMVCTMLASACG